MEINRFNPVSGQVKDASFKHQFKIDNTADQLPLPKETVTISKQPSGKSIDSGASETINKKPEEKKKPERTNLNNNAVSQSVPRTIAAFEDEEKHLLNDNSILKWDRHGHIQGERPNYRKVDGIIGMGQPSISGIEKTLEELGAKNTDTAKGKKIIWTNLREEPVCYIKGETFTVRRKNKVYENLRIPGITVAELEKLEQDFKKDVIEKINKGEDISYFAEDANGNPSTITFKASELKPEDVKTLSEVYEELPGKGYNIDFRRVPISDERKPGPKAFDSLTEIFKNIDPQASYIVNCQGGEGRTTTGMAVFSILKNASKNKNASYSLPPEIMGLLNDGKRSQQAAISQTSQNSAAFLSELSQMHKDIKQASKLAEEGVGKFLLQGASMKRFQKVIDKQGEKGVNLQQVIDKYAEKNPKLTRKYLERYIYLATYYEYTLEQGKDNYRMPFSEWITDKKKAINQICYLMNNALDNYRNVK